MIKGILKKSALDRTNTGHALENSILDHCVLFKEKKIREEPFVK